MPPEAILFDFDGTLADSYSAITESVNYVRLVNHLPPLSIAEVRQLVGHGLLQLMSDIVPGGDPEANAKLYREHHPSVMVSHTHLYPGVLEALEQLHQRGIKMGVCSNKPSVFTRQLVSGLGVAKYFAATLGPEDAGAAKPDPAIIHLALKILGISENHALYIGDMEVDVQTARAANVAVWVVLTGSDNLETLERSNPDRIMRDMKDLVPALFMAEQ